MEESAPKRRRVAAGTRTSGQGAASDASGSRRKERPSFASPTKASLSRHNPKVLDKRLSASPAKPVPRRASDAGSDQSLSDMLTARPDTTVDHVPASEPDQTNDGAPREEAGPSSERPLHKARGGMAGAPRRSPAKPQPRPLPPPAPEGEDDLKPFIGRALRRSPNTGVFIPPPPEPELPPTVLDAVSSTPPRGIHSSPSRWREKRKAAKKSSPLKPPPEKPPAEPSKKAGAASRHHRRRPARHDEPPGDVALNPTTAHARRIAAFDPNTTRIEERDKLRAEIAKLKSDLKTASEENERLRLMETSGRVVAPTNEEEVVDLLRRCLADKEEAPRPALSHQLTQAVLYPGSLFSSGRPSPAAVPLASTEKDNLDSLKSHHPVPMTADEELPYLELFSQFSVTSSIVVLPPQPNQLPRQCRQVTLRSRDVPGLFTAKLEMVVHCMNLGIVELAVIALEPAARFELELFADKICSGKCNRSMQRNVGILSWAMGEWYRVATLRAQLWSRLDNELGSREKLLEAVTTAWEQRRRRRREDSTEPDATEKNTRCSKADLMRFLGQQSFEIEVPAGLDADDASWLRLEWKICFDWTGEAQSKVSVLIGLPGKCESTNRYNRRHC